MRGLFVHTAGPNVAIIKSPASGLFARSKNVTVVIGGRLVALPLIHRVDRLSLELRTIRVTTRGGATTKGVLVNVESCCQVKIRGWAPPEPGRADQNPQTDFASVKLAAQHFIGKKSSDIENAIQNTLEGHQRSIIGALTVEELLGDRNAFSNRVLALATDDMRDMGLSVVSYTVSEITDNTGYIEALGQECNAKAKRDALEGRTLHESRAKARSAQEEATAHLLVNKEQEKKIVSDRDRMITDAESRTEVERARAIQTKAREIADAEENSKLLVAKQKARAAEAHEELNAEREFVKKQRLRMEQQIHTEADAMLYKAKQEADGVRATAEAKAAQIKMVGEANAAIQRLQLETDMDALERKVEIWNKWYVCVFLFLVDFFVHPHVLQCVFFCGF